MLSKDAIQHLEDGAYAGELMAMLAELNTSSPVALVPGTMRVESLEEHMPNASSYRMSYSTTSIDDFTRYNQEHDQEGSACFVDSEQMCAKSIYDLGTKEEPLHKRHKACLQLKQTAAYKALLAVNGQPLSQKKAGEFLEDWSENIKCLAKTDEEMTAIQAAVSLQDLTIEAARNINSKVDDFGASMSTMDKIEAQHQERIPAKVMFTCDPYHGLGKREFVMRVSILTGHDKPQVVFRILRLEANEEDMAEEFKGIIEDSASKLKLSTYIGTAG